MVVQHLRLMAQLKNIELWKVLLLLQMRVPPKMAQGESLSQISVAGYHNQGITSYMNHRQLQV